MKKNWGKTHTKLVQPPTFAKACKGKWKVFLGKIQKESCQCEPFQSPRLVEVNERFFWVKLMRILINVNLFNL